MRGRLTRLKTLAYYVRYPMTRSGEGRDADWSRRRRRGSRRQHGDGNAPGRLNAVRNWRSSCSNHETANRRPGRYSGFKNL